jgi:hypothetical protein
MTEFELAKLVENEDLRDGVVVYDKKKAIVVAKSIRPYPDSCAEHDFLIILDKRTKIRVGAIMSLGYDIQIYIKPMWRNKGYASLVMKEIVPYWMPALTSITSHYQYQNDKIEHLASCAQLTLMNATPEDRATHAWSDVVSEERKKRILANSEYARALASAYRDPKGLLACPDKVKNPRWLRKNIGVVDTEFRMDLERTSRINCKTGDVILPQTIFPPIDFKTASAKDIYLAVSDICLEEPFCEDGEHYIEFTPRREILIVDAYETLHDCIKEEPIVAFIRLSRQGVYISLHMSAGAERWFRENVTDKAEYQEYEWGSISVDIDEYIDIAINRNFTDHELEQVAKLSNRPIMQL